MKRTYKLAAGAAAVLAVAGAGAAIGATKLSSPSEQSQAIVSDAAKQLGVQPDKLSAALKKALENQIDAQVAAGTLTKAQAEELKQQIESNDFPLLGLGRGGHVFGHHGPGFGSLDAAATYLGLSENALHTALESGKSLADVAKAQGKSVDGLVTALVEAEKTKLAAAVTAGRLTQAQADSITANLKQRVTDMVNRAGDVHGPPDGGPSPGFRGFHAPPASGTTSPPASGATA